MSNIDIIVLCGLATGIIAGYIAGIVRIVTVLAILLVSIFLSFEYSGQVISFLRFKVHLPLSTAHYVTYGLFISAGLFVGSWLARYLTKVVKFIFLNWLNKLVGATGGLIIVLVLECIFLNLLMVLPPDKPIITEKQARESILVLPVAGIFKERIEMPGQIEKIRHPQ